MNSGYAVYRYLIGRITRALNLAVTCVKRNLFTFIRRNEQVLAMSAIDRLFPVV
jgi:hypothetical protein